MRQCRCTSDWMIHSPVLMEKIMSKTNDATKTRELTEAELAAVSGGKVTMEDILVTSVATGVVADGGGTGSGFMGWNIRQNKA